MPNTQQQEENRNLLPLLAGGYLAFLFFCPGLRDRFYFSAGWIQIVFLVTIPAAGLYFLVKTAFALYRRDWSDAFAYFFAAFFSLVVLATYIPELGK